MNDRKTGILLAVIITAMVVCMGSLWYLATERTAFTDTIDPQPNLSEESS
jgi:hypothetical protein